MKAVTPVTPKLAGGYASSYVLKSDGSLWSFGLNENGQLGINSTTNSYEPKLIDASYFNNETITRIEAAQLGTVVLTEQKNVYIWGNSVRKTPEKKTLSFPVRDIETTSHGKVNDHQAISVVNDKDGSVWNSGSNFYGSFGNGLSGLGGLGTCERTYTTGLLTGTVMPTLISATIVPCPNEPTLKKIVPGTEVPLLNVKTLSANSNRLYMLALSNEGKVYSWGRGYTTFAVENPNVSSLSLAKVEAGVVPFGLTENGELYYWKGSNGKPIKISLLGNNEPISDISASYNTLLILTESGKLYGLGSNTYNQLTSTITNGEIAVEGGTAKYIGIENVDTIGAGTDHFLYLTKDGELYGIGRNSYGQLANLKDNSQSTFIQIPLTNPIKLINAREKTSYAIDTNENLYSWGEEMNDSLLTGSGRDLSSPNNAPAKVMNFSAQGGAVSMKGVEIDYVHGGVLTRNGSFFNWGNNYMKSNESGGINGKVKEIKNKNTALSSENFILKDAFQSGFNGAVINTYGDIFSWGYDKEGALGMGSFQYDPNYTGSGKSYGGMVSFQRVRTPTGKVFEEVIGTQYTVYARTSEGEVYSWGSSSYGKLGYTSGHNPTPTKISSLPPIQKMVAGIHFVMMLDTNGDVWTFGRNNHGQLGIGTFTSTSTPTKVPNLPKISNIGTGSYSSFAIAENGEVYGWGENRYGQLGLGDRDDRNSPRKLPISNIQSITGGREHTLILTNDGKVLVSGSDSSGQLGLSQEEGIGEPTKIVFTPNVNIGTLNGQTYEQNESFMLHGDVYSQTKNVLTTISYKIEGTNFSKSGIVKTYTSDIGYESYSTPIILDTSYLLGGYSLIVTVATENGFKVHSSISFGILDKTAPTISVDKSSIPTYQTKPITVAITGSDEGASGYRGVDYAWSDSTSRPLIGWNGISQMHVVNATQLHTGKWYLHIEAYDHAGNKTYKYYGPYLIDNTPPLITPIVPSGWSQNKLTFTLDVEDLQSGVAIKKWMLGHVTNKDQLLSNGSEIDFSSKTLTDNQELTFYVEDNVGNGSLSYLNINTINKSPVLTTEKNKIIIPIKQTSLYFSGTVKDPDLGDELSLQTTLNSKDAIFPLGIVLDEHGISFSKSVDISNITHNSTHALKMKATDSKDGLSNEKQIMFERYDPNFSYHFSTDLRIHLNWGKSLLAESYIITRDGVQVFKSSSAYTYSENVQEDTAYNYELWVVADGTVVKVSEFVADTGHFKLSIPSFISFPSMTLTGKVQKVQFDIPSSGIQISNTTQNQSGWKLSAYAEQISSSRNPNTTFPLNSMQMDLKKVKTTLHGDIPLSTSLFLDQPDYVTLFSASPDQANGDFQIAWDENQLSLWIKPDQKIVPEPDFTTKIHWMISFTP